MILVSAYLIVESRVNRIAEKNNPCVLLVYLERFRERIEHV